MTWVRLADDFADHPKVIAAGPLAGWLWVCGLAWANRYLTDGFLPLGAIRRLADVDDAPRLAARLVDIGLWERVDDGYRIHDYAEYQPSAEAVREEREANRERMRSWRERQKNVRSNGVTNAVTPGSPVPDPVPAVNPVPAGAPTPPPPPSQAREGERHPRRRRGSGGESSAAPPPEVELPLAPPTAEDVAVWARALADVADGMAPGNVEQVAALEPIGRAQDGSLRLRAPPGLHGMARFRSHVARALLDAGDAAGPRVVIVEA